MPAKKKEVKVDEPLFVDEEGSYVHEVEGARYKGGVRRYAHAGGTDAAGAPGSPGRPTPGASPGKGERAGSPNAASGTGGAGTAAGGVPPSDALVLRHGRGVYTCPSFTYAGDWVEDEMHGSGQLVFSQSGNAYEGDFYHGCFSGQGTYQWRNGAVYSGQWRANRMHGEGVYTDAQGHVWKGRYYNGTGPGLIRLYPTLERVDVADTVASSPSGAAATTAS